MITDPKDFAYSYISQATRSNPTKKVTMDELVSAYYEGMTPTQPERKAAEDGFKYLIRQGALNIDRNNIVTVP